MSGYIDSEKLKDNVKRYLEKLASHQKIPIYKPIIREISNDICFAIDMLSVDAVEVVRCKDCKRNADNGGLYPNGRTQCPIQEHSALLQDGYCHLGECKEVQRNFNASNVLDALETEVVTE